jgi:hypothetical protein
MNRLPIMVFVIAIATTSAARTAFAQDARNSEPLDITPRTSKSDPLSKSVPQSKPKFCNIPSELKKRVLLYEGCIASRAHDFEITGDSAESVATAVIGACGDYRRRIASFIDSCDMAGVGNQTMQKTEKHFHDYAIRSVIEFRAARVSGKRPEN